MSVSEARGTTTGKEGTRPGAARRRADRLIGTSRALQRAVEQIAVAGRGRFPVFISGEEGVDKEAIARLVHDASEWASGGFFGLDASLVPEPLLVREILGAEAGAIAGLPAAADGAFARVGAGTVLIEHIEAMSKDLQARLSEAIERNAYRRVGGTEDIPLEARLIATSTAGVDALAASGRLVPELSAQLRLLEISLPPLRERRDDILPLAAHVLAAVREEIAREQGAPCPVLGFSRDALERLREHHWPGNERELREQIRAAVRLAHREELGPDDLLLVPEKSAEIGSFREAKRAFEREYVTRVLRMCDGNISRAARIARKDRKDFYDVMRRNSINPGDFRS
jgi:two-component system response regulator GlrR